MKPAQSFVIFVALAVSLLPVGCGHKEHTGHDHDAEEETAHEEHEHEESPSGASFKPGKGVILTDETLKILGVEIADVSQEKLPVVVRFNVQVFGETHRVEHPDIDHAACDIHGSGFLPAEMAIFVKPNAPVRLLTSNNSEVDGFVVAVQKTFAYGETEIIVGVTNAASKLKEGEFVQATITLPREDLVTVIPDSALLRTVEGTFVYVVNSDAFYKTTVKIGSQADGKIEITDGLLPGDQVVAKPVQTLWIIELRATKGGGHSH